MNDQETILDQESLPGEDPQQPPMPKFFLFRWMRQMKAWIESYADRPYAQAALFLLAVIEAIFFPLPPDALLIAMGFSFPKKAFRFALICTVGSLVGAVIGYWIGVLAIDLAMSMVDSFDPSHATFDKIDDLYNQYGFWGVMIAAITPIPFKVFTLASGIFKYNFAIFMIASAIGRSFRFFLVSSMFFFFGKKIKPFIDKYLEVLVILFTILLIGGIVLVKYMH